MFDQFTALGPQWNANLTCRARVGAGEGTVELALPWADVGGPPRPGGVWGLNMGGSATPAGPN